MDRCNICEVGVELGKIMTLQGKSLHLHQKDNEKYNLEYYHASLGNYVNFFSNDVNPFV